MNILQDIKQNQFHQPSKISKSSLAVGNKKVSSSKSGNSMEIQMHIGIAYNQILQMIKQSGLNKNLALPQDGVKSIEKLQLLKKTVQFLIEYAKRGSNKSQTLKPNNGFQQNSILNQSNIISCVDCQNYENNLQKLQNQVRQHIRLQQQLKIYQQSMEQKMQEMKKQKGLMDKKYDQVKKKYEQQKHSSTGNTDKIHKLQFENQKLKAEVKQLKQTPLQTSKKIKGYESREKQNRMQQKQNRMDWGHRMSSMGKKDEKQKQSMKQRVITSHQDRTKGLATDRTNVNERTDRKSMQKRGDSSDRWRMSNARSTKLINFNEKVIQEKNREQRKKAIQSKFEYRR